MNKRFRSYIVENLLPVIITCIVILIVSFSLFFRLGTITSGFAPQELIVKDSSSSISAIIGNPINAPYKLFELGFIKFNLQSPFYIRIVSVSFAITLLILLYFLIKKWISRRVATLTIILLSTSSWFLNNARIATPNIMLPLCMIIILSMIFWQKKTKKPKTLVAQCSILLGLILYTPGMIWFTLPLIIWQFARIKRIAKRVPTWYWILGALGLVSLISPLVYATIKDISLLRTLLGIPTNLTEPLLIVKNILSVPVSLFIRSNQSPYLWLNSTAILDIFTAAMVFLGSYSLFYYFSSKRSLYIFFAGIIGILLYSLQGSIDLILIMPFIYVSVALGLSQMLQKWFTVFPRNPFARTLGASLITILVVMTCVYGTSRYFVAWPNAIVTKEAFTSQQK